LFLYYSLKICIFFLIWDPKLCNYGELGELLRDY
jgi:hypothetical protein